MLITAAILFSSPCHSHPFVLFHFAFLLGTADSSTMAWLTCGILVLLALIYTEPYSHTPPKPTLPSIPAAKAHTCLHKASGHLLDSWALFLSAPAKKSCFLPTFCIQMPHCLNQITSLHSGQTLYLLKETKFECKR